MPYDVSEHASLKIFFFGRTVDSTHVLVCHTCGRGAMAPPPVLRNEYESSSLDRRECAKNVERRTAPHRIANARARDISFRCVSAWSTSDLYLSDFSWGACLSGLLRIVWNVFRVRCLRESRFSRIATQLCHYCRSRNRKRTLRYVWNSYQHNSDVTGKIMISDRNRETLCIFFLHIYYVNTRLLFAANSAW